MVKFWPYKMGSAGSKELAKLVGGKRVYADRKYKPRVGHRIINWGNSVLPKWFNLAEANGCQFLNHPKAVAVASNKLHCLAALHNAKISRPLYTTNKEEAAEFFKTTRRVYCRTLLRGSEGRGIVVANSPEELVDAPLYTAGIDRKRHEYRVHVFGGEVIDFVKKKKMTDETIKERGFEYDNTIRNHDKGWVFAREDVELPDSAALSALNAIKAVGLDFGAVDLIVRDKDPKTAYVLEINTAPGLEGTTLERYSERISSLL